MIKWYKNIALKIIPGYAIFSLPACFLINILIYSGAQHLMRNAYHYDFTTSIDAKIPFVKEWVIIYLTCYIQWIANYILIAKEGKEKWYRFATADIFSRLVCGAFFLLLPTTNERPFIAGNDIFSYLMQVVYQMDMPTNLFPSIHSLVSWIGFIGIRNSKKVPIAYKWFSFIFAVLVFAATQFTKQHILIDVIGGVVIAEICCYIASKTNVYLKIESFFDNIERVILG